MLLSSLKLSNFRQFYGDTEILFSKEPKKNVTLIHGENGVGKTTILNSILWCLFEQLTKDFERPEELICHEAKAEGTNSCSVELTFDYENNTYLVRRFLLDKGKSILKVFLVEDYNHKPVPNPTSFINSVLPPDMASYFFFHGEGISSISEGRSGAAFRRAVRDILGFTFAEAAIDDLQKLKLQYSKVAGGLLTKNKVALEAARKKAEAEEKVDGIENQLRSIAEQGRAEASRLEEIEKKLSNSGNVDATRLKTEIDAVNRRLREIKKEQEHCYNERQALVQKYGWAIFGTEVASKGLDFIDEATLKGRIPSPYQETFVKDLLNGNECICGSELIEGSQKYNRILALLDTANTAIINQRVMKARSAADNMTGIASEFLKQVEQVENKRKTLDNKYGVEEQHRQELEQQFSDIDEEEIKILTNSRNVVRSKLHELLRLEGRVKLDLDQCKGRAEQARKELGASGAGDEQLQRLQKIQDIIEKMMNRCKSRLEEVENSARASIAGKVNEILKEFSRKDFEIRVNNDFEFFLVRNDGGIVAKSKGENLLLNLAFVSALIEMAHRREKASGDFLVQGTVAPFVIDAPFGELDETYKAATARFLPETSKQLILLLSSSHWKGTVDKQIRDRIGAEYLLVSEKRVDRGDKPEDRLLVRGQEYLQSIYGADRDSTAAVEVR